MNNDKILKHNLGKPLEERITAWDMTIADMRANVEALRAQIHRDIEPELRKRREIDRMIDRIGSVSGAHADLKLQHGSKLPGDTEKYWIEPYRLSGLDGNKVVLAENVV